GCSIDIWSFGCLMLEFITGRALFAVMVLGNDQQEQDDADDDHLIQMDDIIEPLPDSVMERWTRASMWYRQDRQRLQPYGNGEIYKHDSLEVLFEKNKPAEIGDTESATLCALMRQILSYDPVKRPSAMDLLKHSWFLK
ncbi:kinase-like domain-containing protein, partial [Phaeosphaeriaceae sp. PMI808]